MAISDARAKLKIEGGLFEGDLFLQIRNADGTTGKRIGPINGTRLAYNPGQGDKKERISRLRGQSGQVINTVFQAGTPTIEFGFNDMGREQLELAMKGTSEDLNEAGGSVTDEAVVVKKGSWNRLPHRNISSTGLVITGTGGTPTYTLDQTGGGDIGPIDYKHGLIFVPPNSAIADGATLEFDYSHFAVTGYRVRANTIDQIRGEVLLLGTNKADPDLTPWELLFHQVNVEPTETPDFLGEDFIGMAFSGTPETPAGKTEPFMLDRLILATS